MKRMIYKIKDFYLKHPEDLFSLFIIILGVGSLFYDDGFLINPILLSCLFLIYYQGTYSLAIYFYLSTVIGFISSVSLGVEIIFLFVIYILANYLFHRIKNDNQVRYIALGMINLFLSILVLIHEFSFASIMNIILYLLIQTIIVYTLTKTKDKLFNKVRVEGIVTPLFFFLVSISLMFLNVVGGVFFGLVSLISLTFLTTNHKLVFLLATTAALLIIFQYSLPATMLIVVPFLAYFLPIKYRRVSYLFLHSLLCVFYDTPIFYNFQFYCALISVLLLLLIPKKFYQIIYNLFYFSETEEVEEKENNNLKDYLEILKEAFIAKDFDQKEYIEKEVKNNLCSKCEHLAHCRLQEDISSLLFKKITKDERAEINASCLKPFKFVLEVEGGNKRFEREMRVIDDNLLQREQIVKTIDSLKDPIFDENSTWTLKEILSDYGVEVIKEKSSEKRIVLNVGAKTYKNHFEDIKEGVRKYDSRFKFSKIKIDALTHSIDLFFDLQKEKEIDVGEFTIALIPGHNGDNYVIEKNEGYLEIVLCDGMGSGEVAEQNSKYLRDAFLKSLRFQHSYSRAIEDVNRLLLLKSKVEQYSTLDYLRLDLRNLVLTMVKAGSFTTYLWRKDKLKVIPNNNLPLGIVDEVNICPIKYQLQEGDRLLLVTDGFGEKFEKNKGTIKWQGDNASSLVRCLYQQLKKYEEFKDDATAIVIEIK